MKGSAGVTVAASIGTAATKAQAATVRSVFCPLPVATAMKHGRFMFDPLDLTEAERADPVLEIALRYRSAVIHYYDNEGDDGESEDMNISDRVWSLTPQSLAAHAVRLALARWNFLITYSKDY